MSRDQKTHFGLCRTSSGSSLVQGAYSLSGYSYEQL